MKTASNRELKRPYIRALQFSMLLSAESHRYAPQRHFLFVPLWRQTPTLWHRFCLFFFFSYNPGAISLSCVPFRMESEKHPFSNGRLRSVLVQIADLEKSKTNFAVSLFAMLKAYQVLGYEC